MVTLVIDDFGTYTDEATSKSIPIKRFTWSNHNNISVQVITYGATIISIKTPDKDNVEDDIVTGFDDLVGYCNPDNPYFGATIGRVANRIKSGQFTCQGVTIQVSKNHGEHFLHGGVKGFDKAVWEHILDGSKVILSYHSADLEEGFPGDVITHVRFELRETNEFVIEFKASTTKPTYINLTNHVYFNLAGHNAGVSELHKHWVSINADQITEVDDQGIPTGNLLPVTGTVFDFKTMKVLGDVINNVPNSPGFDHNFCISPNKQNSKFHIARLHHPGSERCMDIYSNQPGVQFYTSNFLPEEAEGPDAKVLTGKAGTKYYKHGALCLETQNWPDAPNHRTFPKAILKPGETYYHYVAYQFYVKNCACLKFTFGTQNKEEQK